MGKPKHKKPLISRGDMLARAVDLLLEILVVIVGGLLVVVLEHLLYG
jgi:hypothetical protein